MEKLLLLAALLPLVTHLLCKKLKPESQWMFAGISYGLIIAPVSLALFQCTSVPVIGKLCGLIGVILNLIHGPIGYFIALGSGYLEPGAILSVANIASINIANGIIWALFYGIIGYNIDAKLAEIELGSTEILPQEEAVVV
jgi:hypothetical protein